MISVVLTGPGFPVRDPCERARTIVLLVGTRAVSSIDILAKIKNYLARFKEAHKIVMVDELPNIVVGKV